MESTRRVAYNLAQEYETRDPFQIARSIGCIVIFTPLQGIRGFYQQLKRSHVIYIDDGLEEHEKAFVCAHELGHILLHRSYNRIFMDTHTLAATGRYEAEANRFAVDLIYSDDELRELGDCSISTAIAYMGVGYELAIYRMRGIR